MGKKWTTIVGDHAPKVEAPKEKPPVVRYVLDTVTNAGDAAPAANAEQRSRLLYEKGVGPQAPDEKPEPKGGPRDRRTFRPASRPPQPWTGRGDA